MKLTADCDSVTATIACPCCGKEASVTVPKSGWIRWKQGALIQSAFPHLTPDERELLLSGICGPCWNITFGEED